ncbi:helix-turn-helix domain-containing protein [Caenimonas sedimenti]|uniref:Helix-turn-helix domain-containing protein n=1 Tax=Caenimonas sedimenti TaxID=2596921 RepID=A0A562ZK87_9BURK|nr:helix-turn-helix domain-containing protein [Caenimonas sedimenti]
MRDAAYDLFNLEADLDGAEPERVYADLRLRRGPAVSMVEVCTSWSIVRRTRARASASPTDHLLLYRIAEGGSTFRNARGEQFLTRPGSIVVGSQASAYTAAPAPGRHWKFRTLRIDAGRLPQVVDRVRRTGFQLLPEAGQIAALASEYLAGLEGRLAAMSPDELDPALQALDTLLAASLGAPADVLEDAGRAVHAARIASARGYIERLVSNPHLTPEHVGRHLGISARQVHRIFAREGLSVTLEIRRLRVARAQAMLMREPARSVTDIALACGFDSLATFYRSFRAVAGMTATEWRCEGTA